MNRWFWIVVLLVVGFGCSSDSETGVSVERVVSGDWTSRFADDPSAHLVSLPPEQSFFDAWVYQFGGSPSEWPTGNMECGPACVSILERLSGRSGTSCAYVSRVPGCPDGVHSECRQTGVCGRSTGFSPSSARGTSVYQMRDVLEGLGFTTRVYSGMSGDRMSLSALQRAIDENHPVVATVNACEYQRELSLGVCSRSHFIVAYGYSDAYVYILDPGYRNGQRARISIDAFNRAIVSDPSGLEVTRPGFSRYPNATWYPPGTLLQADGEFYYVVSPSAAGSPRLWHVPPMALRANRLSAERAIRVSADAVDCFESLGELDATPHFREYRIDTGEIFLVNLATRERYVFLNYAAYLSHDGREEWVHAAPEEIASWSDYPLRGTLGFAPGTLIGSEEPGVSTVWAVSYNERGRLRLPIFNEETARVYGYDAEAIGGNPLRSARVAGRDLDLLAGPEGEMLRIELARDCRGRHCLTADECFHHAAPGGTQEASGDEREGATHPDVSDAGYQGPVYSPSLTDAGLPDPPPRTDAGTDSGTAPPITDPSRVRITLSPALHDECPGGYVMNLWGAGVTLMSEPGRALDGSVAGWSGWSGLTLSCPTGGWHDWTPDAGRTARQAGIASILLGDRDIADEVLVCVEPWNPSGGYRPAISWDDALRGRCP